MDSRWVIKTKERPKLGVTWWSSEELRRELEVNMIRKKIIIKFIANLCLSFLLYFHSILLRFIKNKSKNTSVSAPYKLYFLLHSQDMTLFFNYYSFPQFYLYLKIFHLIGELSYICVYMVCVMHVCVRVSMCVHSLIALKMKCGTYTG